jgi:16S rRNA (guanine966-N2)-methyltransferase
MREALFSSLHSRLGSFAELRVLDVFAGSGALGLEALSRGASFLVAVESDPKACRSIESNYDSLQGASQKGSSSNEYFRLYRGDIFKMTTRLQGLAVDLAFFDPPYNFGNESLHDLLRKLAEKGTFAQGSLIVVERSKTKEVGSLFPENFTTFDTKTKGETSLHFASYMPNITYTSSD